MIDRTTLEKAVLPLAAVIAWELAGRAGWLPIYLSRPSAIAAALVSRESGELRARSRRACCAGLALGAGAMLVELGAGMTAAVRHFFDPGRVPLPSSQIAFLSVFLLMFGIGGSSRDRGRGVLPVYIAARRGTPGNPLYVWSGRNMGAGRATVFRRVVLPAAMPQLFSGLRIGLAHTFVILFAAELIGARNGLGYMLVEGEEALRFDIMFAAIAAFAAIGFASDRVLMAVRRKVLRGQIIGTQEEMP
jgi:ABC-type nitrate/sulfonate/bicarbonate transport system permease component